MSGVHSLSSAKYNGACFSAAFLSNTGFVSGVVSPITTGTPGLIMPAFSPAISSSVFPKNCVWSKLMLVMTQSSGVMMFVQSSRPPSPTSTTAMSTFFSAKYLKASAVVSSKKEG